MSNTFIQLTDNSILPKRSTSESVGYDLYISHDFICRGQMISRIHLGISLNMESHLWAQILSRSSLALKGLFVHGGVIDSDYHGELCVLLYNSNNVDYTFKSGERIAQLVFHNVIVFDDENKNKRKGGFGSTGK